jgi:hypothetical protein
VDRLALVYASSPLLFWALGSVAIYILGTNLVWLLQPTGIGSHPFARALRQVLRFLFYLGIPYLALGGWPRHPFEGYLTLDDLGLVGLNANWPATRWLSAAGTTVGLGLIALLTLALAWANASRTNNSLWLRFPRRPWWAILADTIYLQAHWAFYRSALAVTMENWVPAILFGLALVYLEWSLNPFWRRAWHSSARAATTWLRAALALVVAFVFLLTRNLWACVAIHLLLEGAFHRLLPAPVQAQTG